MLIIPIRMVCFLCLNPEYTSKAYLRQKSFFYSQKVTLPIGKLTKQTIVTNRLRCLRKYFCSADNFKNIFAVHFKRNISPLSEAHFQRNSPPPPHVWHEMAFISRVMFSPCLTRNEMMFNSKTLKWKENGKPHYARRWSKQTKNNCFIGEWSFCCQFRMTCR